MDNFETMTSKDMASELGFCLATITKRMTELGLRRHGMWTVEEDEYLREFIDTRTCAELADDLLKHVAIVRSRCKALGLKRKNVKPVTKEEYYELGWAERKRKEVEAQKMAKGTYRTYHNCYSGDHRSMACDDIR